MKERGTSSIFVPVILAAMVFAITIGFVQQAASIKKLNHTAQVACDFYTADADTRQRQAQNTARQLAAQHRYQHSIGRLIRLFTHPRPQTSQQQQTVTILTVYLSSQSDVLTAQITAATANLRLTRTLAKTGHDLASQLHCQRKDV